MNDRKYIVLSLSDSEDDSSDDELLKPVVGVQPSAAPSELRARTRPDPPSANSSSSNSGSTNNNTTASTDDGVAVAVAATSTKNDAVTTKMSEGSSPLLCTEGDGIEQLILADRVVSCSPPCDNMSVTEEDVPSPAIEDDSNVLVSIVWGNERALRNVPSSSLDKFNGDSDAFASLVHQNAALESEPIRNATPTSHDTPLPSSQTHGHRDEPACVSVSSNNLNATTARSSVGSEDSSGSAGLHEIAQAPTTTTTTCARMKGMGCGKCHGCRTPCCQICRICKLRRGEDTPLSACVFRDCVHLSESVRAYRKTTAERLSKKHRLSTRIDVSSLATQTETAAAVVGNEDAETTTPLSSVALFSDSASSSSSSSSRGSDDYVTRTVGRTTKRAPTLTTGRTGTQCGVCRRCRRKPCGECSFCESNNTALKCVLKCCDGNTREVKLLYGKAVGETLEQEQRHRTISTCMNVYCWWKETEVSGACLGYSIMLRTC